MSVVAEASVRQRIWRGYDDPGLPMGAWVGWVQGTGDMSAGDNILALILEPEGQPLSGNFYNLEALEITTTQATNVPASIILNNLSGQVDGAFFNRQWTAQIEFNDRSDGALALRGMLPRPLFLGQSDQPGTPTQILCTTDNSDGDVVVMRCEGYIWGARATQSEGGLRRPADALYG